MSEEKSSNDSESIEAELHPHEADFIEWITAKKAETPSSGTVWYTPSEAADYLDITMKELRKLVREDRLCPHKSPEGKQRFCEEVLEDFLELREERAQRADPDSVV